MTKPVTAFTVFGSNTTGTTTQLDNNFLTLKNAVNDFNTYANFLLDTGAANAYVVSLPANITGPLTNGLPIQMRVANTNSGASVLNYNLTGNAPIINLDGTAIAAGQLQANAIVVMQYANALSSWFLQTPNLTANSAAGGSSLVLISAQSAANANQIFFNNVISATFDQYELRMTNVAVAGNDSNLYMLVGTGNAPTYQTANYSWGGSLTNTNILGVVGSTANSLATRFPIAMATGALTNGLFNGANASLGAVVTIMGGNANAALTVTVRSSYLTSDQRASSLQHGGLWNNMNAVTSLQIVPSNANITSGNFALYGMRKS